MFQSILIFSPKFRRNVKTTKKKIAFTAFLTTLLTLGIFIPIFWFNNNASPLGTYIEVCITCAETGTPIEGLKISVSDLAGTFTDIKYTGADGCTGLFGSGYESGTYIIEWFWNELYSYTVEIDCSQAIWHFDYTVPNPTIIKHFEYDLPEEGAIVGLSVSLYKDDAYVESQLTDASGTVSWTVDIEHTYYLAWTWNGEDARTLDIDIFYLVDGKLLDCTWEETNYLEPKSWWRQK